MPDNIPRRACEGCTACCTTHAVALVKAAPGTTCRDCLPNQGCAIYPTRPKPCRDFECWWLKGSGMESDRPDRLGVVIDSQVIEFAGRQITLVGFHEFRSGGLSQTRVRHIAWAHVDRGSVVVFRSPITGAAPRFHFPLHLFPSERDQERFVQKVESLLRR